MIVKQENLKLTECPTDHFTSHLLTSTVGDTALPPKLKTRTQYHNDVTCVHPLSGRSKQVCAAVTGDPLVKRGTHCAGC